MKKDTESIKMDQSEVKNVISEINNILEGIKSRLDEAEFWINGLKDKVEKTPKQNRKKKKEFKKQREL